MVYLFIGGASDTGKTTLISSIADSLIKNNGYVVSPNLRPIPANPNWDFITILEGLDQNGIHRRILINTATDDLKKINELIVLRNQQPIVDVVITSIRDAGDPMRPPVLTGLNIKPIIDVTIEFPLAKVTRRKNPNAYVWYQSSALNLARHLLSLPPFSLY